MTNQGNSWYNPNAGANTYEEWKDYSNTLEPGDNTLASNGVMYDPNMYVMTPEYLRTGGDQKNPYLDSYKQSENAAMTGMKEGSQNISSWGSQLSDMQAGQAPTSGYPTMANSYGLGSQGGPAPSQPMAGGASSSDYGSSPVTNPASDNSSRGFNPWSLSGESNARGKS